METRIQLAQAALKGKITLMRLALLLWGIAVFGACVPTSGPVTSQAPPTPVEDSPVPTATLMPIPSPSPPTVEETTTPVQATPVPTTTPFPTPTQVPPPSPVPTVEETADPSETGQKPEPELLASSSSESPDGLWRAEGQLAYVTQKGNVEGYRTTLQVSRVDGSASWMLVDTMQGAGLGYTVPEIYHWSPSGDYLYFTNRAVPDGCAFFVNGSDLYRADLHSGEVVEVMPGLARSLALSPDETMVAYFPWGPGPDLILRDLATGNERHVTWEIPFDNPGNIVWAPDGRSLALTLSTNSCIPPDWSHTIVKVDGIEPDSCECLPETKILVTEDLRLPMILEWTDPGALLLEDKEGARWWLDVTTGELSEVS